MRTKSTSPATRRARPVVALAISLVLVGLLASPAIAGRYVDRAAAGLRRDPVYVDSAVKTTVSAADARRLRDRVRRARTPVYLAVLPGAALNEAGGNPDRLAAAVEAAMGRGGTVAVWAGGRTGAASNTLDPGIAASAARGASQSHRGDVPGVMLDFVARVDSTAAAEEPFWRTALDQPLVRPIVYVVGGLIVLTLLDVVVVNLLRRRRKGRTSGFGDVRVLAREDIVALGDDLRNLDVGLEAESDNPRALRDYTRAYESFQQAVEAFERAEGPNDFAAVSTALEAGRYYMTVARARFEGREIPQRRPPCFFDTRHGPSVDDVGWIPRSGPPRPVPACGTCMWSIANSTEPPAREVVSAGRKMPFYDAPPHFESWFAGYFGGAAASLVDGFPLGRALDDGYAGGLNTFGGGYGYLPVSYADTGVLDAAGGDIGQRSPGADSKLTIRQAGYDADTEG